MSAFSLQAQSALFKTKFGKLSENAYNSANPILGTIKKPWVNMEAATTDAIIEQVRKCPSGALSYFMNAAGENSSEKEVRVVS